MISFSSKLKNILSSCSVNSYQVNWKVKILVTIYFTLICIIVFIFQVNVYGEKLAARAVMKIGPKSNNLWKVPGRKKILLLHDQNHHVRFCNVALHYWLMKYGVPDSIMKRKFKFKDRKLAKFCSKNLKTAELGLKVFLFKFGLKVC